MTSLLLLIFSTMTGCELMSDRKNCTGGWVRVPFNNTETKGNCQMAYGNHTNCILTVITRKPMNENKNKMEKHCDEQKLVKSDCIKPFNQTGYIAAKVTIRCDYPREENKSREMFFCKDNNSICEDILPPQFHQKWIFTNNSQGFNVSISNVSLQDKGVYWCGVKLSNSYALKKIRLEVKSISGFTKSETVGKNFTFLCNYTQSEQSLTKFICKGDDPSACQTLANTNNTSKNERFSMNDNKTQTNIIITVREVTANDSGTYWCGAESPNKQHSDMFFSKLFLIVVSATSSPTTVSSTTVSLSSGLLVEPITLTLVCLSVLLFPVVLILIYKQKNTGTGTAPQHNREDCSYERIQEKLRKTNSKNLENPSESAEYATVNFQGCFDTVRPSTTACEYTTVKFGRYPTNGPSFSHPD
ncbi:unnamed protein product [Oreochromis niloticus]|nr:unnamed protein product [Mustela putorius furo]